MAGGARRPAPKKSKVKAAGVSGTDVNEQPVVTSALAVGNKRTIGSIAKGFLNFYLFIAAIYFFWTF
jgi:hypothetical protein